MKNSKRNRVIAQLLVILLMAMSSNVLVESASKDEQMNNSISDMSATTEPKKKTTISRKVYKLLKKNRLADKSLLSKIVKKKKFLELILFIFDYEDAEDVYKQASDKKLTVGLESYQAGETDLTFGDAIKLMLRTAKLSDIDAVAEEYFEFLKKSGVIPQSKELASRLNYSQAIDVMDEVRNERAEYFEKVREKNESVEKAINTKKSKKDVLISPSGEYEAYLDNWNGIYNVFVKNKSNGSITRVSNVTTSDVAGVQWADDRLLYLKDNGGDECYHIFFANFAGQKEKDLTPRKGKSFHYAGFKLVDGVFFLYVRMYDRAEREFIYYSIDTTEDVWQRISLSAGYLQFTTLEIPGDKEHYLKITMEFNGGENAKIYLKNKKTQQEDLIFETIRNKQFIPQFLSDDGKTLYGLSNQKTKMLCPVALGINDGDLKVLYKDPDGYDVLTTNSGTPICKLGSSEILAVQYYAKTFRSVVLDDGLQKTLQKIKEKIGCDEVRILSISDDLNRFMVQKITPLLDGDQYSYDDQKGTLTCTKSGECSDFSVDLGTYARPISFWSRDKKKIEGYLTLPVGKAPESLPTIVLVHGGPWARDEWRCTNETLFWKSRGYAVLRINYRGSVGYGREFFEAGDRQWGQKIQNDITDGTKWLIKKGIADGKRICISGGSYGGFSALWGLTFEPELYACGISLCGFSDVMSFWDNMPDVWRSFSKQLFVRIGDPVNDVEKFKKISPAYHLERITKPLFVAQGANDPRVKRVESDRVVETLRKNGQDVTYIVRENEGHGFRQKQNILDFYRRTEKFLNKHLKPSKITELEL